MEPGSSSSMSSSTMTSLIFCRNCAPSCMSIIVRRLEYAPVDFQGGPCYIPRILASEKENGGGHFFRFPEAPHGNAHPRLFSGVVVHVLQRPGLDVSG